MEASAKKSVLDVFEVQDAAFAKTAVKVFATTPDTPAVTKGFRFVAATLRRLMVWAASASLPAGLFDAQMKRNLMMFRPTGCGKSKLAREFCARTGRSLFTVQCSEDTEPNHFFGSW
jgi:cobaltochelatase CobS